MSIANLQIFQKTFETAEGEMQAQAVELFNANTAGGILLQNGTNPGDYAQTAMYAKTSGLVQERDIDGSDSLTATTSSRIVERSVKIARAVRHDLDSACATWIGIPDGQIAANLAKQLAGDKLADILNTGIAAFVAATTTVGSTLVNDAGGVAPSWTAMADAAQKIGDRANSIVCWVMHSAQWNALYKVGLSGTNTLFKFGDVAFGTDPFGRKIVVTDSTALVSSSDYFCLGLVAGGIQAILNTGEDTTEIVSSVANENISRVLGIDYSYNLGMKGYQWDSSHGGNSPAAAAIATGTNWDVIATSVKDMAGVIMQTHLSA
jgi:hypothetical protein